MNTAKKVLCTIGAGLVAGLVLGVLYAPCEGVETRSKLARLKRKITCSPIDEEEDEKETLQEFKRTLQKELDWVNARIEKS